MVVLELFAGTRSIGKAFEKRGHKVYSVEWDKKFDNIALYADISTLTTEDVIKLCGGVPDVIWASPDCATYSVARMFEHRKKNDMGELLPQTEYAKFCDKTNEHLVELIKELHPRLWFIENPRGGLRKMSFMQGLPRYTVTYCQYGDNRMKPTDIWTNHPDPRFKPMCKNGDPCHQSSPRGSTIRALKSQGYDVKYAGTTGLHNSVDRARIPIELCEHIVDICEGVT